MAAYQDQLTRVRRFLARIEQHNRPHDEYDDDMWSFFQNCWHVKDWIKYDPGVPSSVRTSIEATVMGSPHLMICADLANARKHLVLMNPRIGAKHSHKNYRIVVGESSKVEYLIDTGSGTKVDGLTLARACVTEWERILCAIGLSA